MALGAYYAGPGRIRVIGGKAVMPSYVRPYVDDVMEVYRRICAGRPGR